jgi:hypothetical protein
MIMRISGLFRPFLIFLLIVIVSGNGLLLAGPHQDRNKNQTFQIENKRVRCSVVIKNEFLFSDCLEPVETVNAEQTGAIETDADFGFQVVWTGWQAPGKLNNAENPACFTKENFRFLRCLRVEQPGETKDLTLFFRGINHPLEIRISYRLGEDNFYATRKLAIRDPESGHHFLHWIWSRQGTVPGKFDVLNRGGFGQPLAFRNDCSGFFVGLEYPASENILTGQSNREIRIGCGQEMGELIGGNWIEGEPVVLGVTPANRVKSEFMKYVNDIRVVPLRPYCLYNTWYDLRAPEMVKRRENVLNEQNVMRIIGSFEANMTRPYGLKLDAFVLDDGWDIYQSDWVLRPEQFPRGLKPIADRLRMSGTDLGIWIGPTGGYSNRNLRLEWMNRHGYELVGDQLCLAGQRYKSLLKQRVYGFVRSQGIGYFKWDGIQFSCSQPDHGHATGIYSRRAVMESLKDLCRTARVLNPQVFLNVTSGTWLSPWWVKFANTIWMQGNDYGYANVPSISQRDRAMTYRDCVLYEGLRKNNFWFPLANLMTHGIIKGHLQKLGGESEPLDRFTDNALLYFARGVSMWELYISPDLLTHQEWEAIARSMIWARDRFATLMSTEMVGGNPGEKEAYGYLHLNGEQGILAVRNPSIDPAVIDFRLNDSNGFKPGISGLVLERIYPTRWISPETVGTGDEIKIRLQGYETAIYELYPLSNSAIPLLTGAVFQVAEIEKNQYAIEILESDGKMRLMNPEKIRGMTCEGKPMDLQKLDILAELSPPVLDEGIAEMAKNKKDRQLKILADVHPSVQSARLAVLLENPHHAGGWDLPAARVARDGQEQPADIQKQEGSWEWIMLAVSAGRHTIEINLAPVPDSWPGKISVWLLADQRVRSTKLCFDLFEPASPAPAPCSPRPSGILHRIVKLKEFDFQ